MENPMLYLEAMKNTLENKDGSYEEFLQIMLDYWSGKISTLRFIAKVRGLFTGHQNLIKGFNTFLPMEYQIVLPEEVRFVEKVRTVFCNDQRKIIAFLGILKKYAEGSKSIIEVYQEVAILFHGHHDLLLEFRNFLPDTSIKSPILPPPDHVLPSRKKRKIGNKSVAAEKEKIICSTQDEFFDRLKANISKADVHEKVKICLQLYDLEVVTRVQLLKLLADYLPEQVHWIDEYLENSEERLDLSKLEQITPSYSRVLPKLNFFEEEDNKRRSEDPERWSKFPSIKRSSELNNEWKIKDARETPSKFRTIHSHEKELFKCEDKMFKIDIDMCLLNQTVKCAKALLEELKRGVNIGNLEGYFSVASLDYIKLLCGRQLLALLRSNVGVVLPDVLERLEVKQKEGLEARAKFGVVMNEYDKKHKKRLKENAKVDKSQRSNYKVNLGLV